MQSLRLSNPTASPVVLEYQAGGVDKALTLDPSSELLTVADAAKVSGAWVILEKPSLLTPDGLASTAPDPDGVHSVLLLGIIAAAIFTRALQR